MQLSDLIDDVRKSWQRVVSTFSTQREAMDAAIESARERVQDDGQIRPDAEERELTPEMRESLNRHAGQVMDEYEEDFRRLAD